MVPVLGRQFLERRSGLRLLMRLLLIVRGLRRLLLVVLVLRRRGEKRVLRVALRAMTLVRYLNRASCRGGPLIEMAPVRA